MPQRFLSLLACFPLVALFASSVEAAAIPIGEAFNIVFHSESFKIESPGPPTPEPPNIKIDGVLTVVLANGQFLDLFHQDFYSFALMATGITGTVSIDCSPSTVFGQCGRSGNYTFSSIFPLGRGDGSYLLPSTGLGALSFGGDGASFFLFNDLAYNYFYAPDVFQVPVTWSATRVPDTASSLLLLAIGMAGIAYMKRAAADSAGVTGKSLRS